MVLGNWKHGIVILIMGKAGLSNFSTLASWVRKLASCYRYPYHRWEGGGRAEPFQLHGGVRLGLIEVR